MKPATLACLAILLLVPGVAQPRSIEAPKLPAQTQKSPPAPAAEAPAGQLPRTGERKRRTSYARCNRISHERNLRGGVRRRFLIRCRLGYEKPRPPQQAVPTTPAQPQQTQPAQGGLNPTSPPQAQPAPPAKRP